MMKRIITISRQFGSGGREIGQALASELGLEFYDKKIITLAAKESGIDEKLFEHADEKETDSFLYSFAMGGHGMGGAIAGYSDYITNDKLFIEQSKVMRKIAAQGPCVIVGRCADYILKDMDCVNVFIHADLEARIARVMKEYGLSHGDAKAFVKKTDKRRSNYYNYYSDKAWGSVSSYHLCLDTGMLPPAQCVELLREYVSLIEES